MKPYVLINFACSIDGKIALEGGRPYKFSNLEDLQRVHRLRSEVDAILVGKNTINSDDPKLVVNPKYYSSDKVPDAVVLDSRLQIKESARVFDYNRKVILITGSDINFNNFKNKKAEVLVKKCDSPRPGVDCIVKILGDLEYKKILVEGGKSVITSFLESQFWDEISIFYSPVFVGDKGVSMLDSISTVKNVTLNTVTGLGNGFLVTIKR